jgi:hypothetical protein
MEIITALGGVAFVLLLAVLAISPHAIAAYLESRTEPHAGEAAQ